MRMRLPSPAVLVAGAAVVSLWTAVLARAESSRDLSRDAQDRAMRACVRVITPIDAQRESFMTGSGTLVDGEGLVITNFHCVGRKKGDGEEWMEKAGLEVGDFYNAEGKVVVAVSDSWSKPPQPVYWARVVAGDPDLDIAILKIVEPFSDTKQPLRRPLPVTTLKIGDSEQVRPGSPVYVFGYPSVGGETITFTTGIVAGLLDDDPAPPTDWLKTTAVINRGNSGGTAVDADGSLIAIPTMARLNESDHMNFLRCVAHAVPLLEKARLSARTSAPTPSKSPGPSGPAALEPLRFGTAWDEESGISGVADEFLDAKQVWAEVRYRNVKKGAIWRYAWTLEGEVVLSKDDLVVKKAGSGTFGLGIHSENGLPAGVYTLQVHVDGALLGTGRTTVRVSKSEPAPKTTLRGMVLDRATGRPIVGAGVRVLKPGVDVEDVKRDASVGTTALLYGTTNVSGRFSFPDAVPVGGSYSIYVDAEGYAAEYEKDAIDTRKPGPHELTIRLDRRD